jgi:hypothetical protein
MSQRPEVYFCLRPASARKRFIVEHVLRRMLGWDAQEAGEEEARTISDVPLLLVGEGAIAGAFHVKQAADLDGMDRIAGPVPNSDPDPIKLFPTEGDDLGFDLFAAAFYFVSLSQEYTIQQRDMHGRVPSAALMQTKCGLLDRPFVDDLVLRFAERWKDRDPRVPSPRRTYRHVATMDVDNGFRYKGRELWRTIGAAGRDLLGLGFGRVSERLAVLQGSQDDPYDVYREFMAEAKANADRVILNFLVAPRGKNDHAVGVSSADMRERMHEAARSAEVGVHPSYESSVRPGMIAEERSVLEKAIEGSVQLSRQHFLRMHLPDTYLELERIGIKEDHSIGLADTIGFRAGTCTPFPFYDLRSERETGLMLHPFCVMDSALAYKLHLTPDQALRTARTMVDRVKQVNGTFCAVWHERFYSDHGPEKGWKKVIEGTLIHAKA